MSYTICETDAKCDRIRLLELWGRNLPDASPGRYSWLYEDGPAKSWLVRSDAGEVVGATGLMGRRMKVFDQIMPGGQAVDLNIDRLHRTIGPALELQRAVTATVGPHQCGLIYAFPNRQSEPVLRRAGYRELGSMGRWARPLRCDDALPSWLRHRLTRKAASASLDWLLHLCSAEIVHRRPKGVRVEVSDYFDQRFDTLWEEAAGRFAVVGERTSSYLNWRFCRCPDARHRVFCLSDAQDKLLSYLVYSEREGNAYIADMFFADARNLDPLLAEFIGLMRRQQVRVIITVFVGSSVVPLVLARFGFRKRPSTWKLLVYADAERLGSNLARLTDQENWFLTRADVDTEF